MPIMRVVLVLSCTLAAGCSMLPPVKNMPPYVGEPPAHALVDGPASPEAASVAVSIRVGDKFLDVGYQNPILVYFVRVSGLNGSPCQPREKRFDDGLEVIPLEETVGEHVGMIGALEGQGGFAAGGDPTCMFNEAGLPVWEPVLYATDHVRGSTAYLINVPPGRYTVVAAVYASREADVGTSSDSESDSGGGLTIDLTGDSESDAEPAEIGTATLFLPEQAVFESEVAVPPGAARYIGRLVVGRRIRHKYDAVQNRFRAQVEALGPSRMERFVDSLLTQVFTDDEVVSHTQESSKFVRVERSGEPLDYFLTGLPYHLGAPSPWVERFRIGSLKNVERLAGGPL